MDTEVKASLVEMTAQLTAAYVAGNRVESSEVAPLMESIFVALSALAERDGKAPSPAPVPAVPIKRSVTPDYIICLEDGQRFKSLKRHLKTRYNMTPDQYRAKWGLAKDYPMVSPNYARQRSNLAQTMGLGRRRRNHRDGED
jgi:predicted transcriptional regulator